MKRAWLFVPVLALCSCSLMQQEPSSMRIKNGTPDSAEQGKEVALAYGAVNGVNGHSANGVGSVHIMEDGTSIVVVQLNIAAAEDDYFYAAWMESENSQRVPLGRLTNPFNDVRHSLHEEIAQDLRESATLRITLEADDGNPEPGSTVAEGILRLTRR